MVFPAQSLSLCCILELLRADTESQHTPTSHHTPHLLFGNLLCKWGPGTADISWRGNFGDMMLGEKGMQLGKDAWHPDTQRRTNPVLG